MRTYILALIILTGLSACGFKPINQFKQTGYLIKKIDLIGDKRVGYFIKDEIFLSSSVNAEKTLNMTLDVNKKKEIKEKNISGKISSYTLTLNVNLFVENTITSKEIRNKFTKSESYNVASNHSDTLNNEKETLENLAEKITEDIINFLTIYLKD